MGRTRHASVVDPATGKTLPPGVCCRGPDQYLARKMVNGRRVSKTFETAKRASDWIKAVEVDTSRGMFVDRTKAHCVKLGSLLRTYQLEALADDPNRVVLDGAGKPTRYRPIWPIDKRMSTELLGATHEISFIDVIMRDEVCLIRMADLSGADTAQFRNRMKLQGYAPSTIVRRLNLIARAIKVSRLEWEINIPTNPADASQCARPRGADRKRDRILLPAPTQREVVAVGQGIEGKILPPLADRDDFIKGEQELLFESCALQPWCRCGTPAATHLHANVMGYRILHDLDQEPPAAPLTRHRRASISAIITPG